MHHPSPTSKLLGFFPSPFSPYHMSISDMTVSKDSTNVTCPFSGAESKLNTSWEKRCLRKHRRRDDDEACSPKRRRLTEEEPEEGPKPLWSQHSSPTAAPVDPAHGPPQPPRSQHVDLAIPSAPSPLPSASEADGSCMEVEAAQRRLQEIEDRITLEDDDEEEDLDVEPAQRRPVLVLSDSLKQGLQGLQRGIGDILPHHVAESVSHSCMQLVVWRPPEDALARRLKDSLQRQRKHQQQYASRQSPNTGTARAPPTPPPQMCLKSLGEGALSPAFGSQAAQGSGEEDMEL